MRRRSGIRALGILLALVLALAVPGASQGRTDGNWRGVLTEGKGLWWEELSYGCNLYSFRRVRSRVIHGRLVRMFHTRNIFTGQCQRRVGPIQGTTAVWTLRRGVLRMYFVLTGSYRLETARLLTYTRISPRDRLVLSRGGVAQAWFGCLSDVNPYPC